MYSSPPGQRYSHVPDSYANQAYGYGGNYSGMDDQRMHIFPPTSGPSPSVLGSTLTHPPQKKKEAHTKQRKYEDEDDSDSEGVASVDSDSDDDSDWRERERRKWGKAPPPVVPPGAAEFQHSVRSTHPFHPLHIPFDNSSPFIPFSRIIEFKRKGALMAGISLLDAQSTQTKLAGNDYYTLHDLHADRRAGGRIHVRVYWAEFSHLTYEIPLDVHDGRVIMEALSRRVARACSHYLACNMAPVMYNRVELHHLREIAYGVWQPMLSAH